MSSYDEPLNALAAALRRARAKSGLTVETLAAASGVPAVKVVAYEAGTEETTLLEVCALAKAMDTTVEAIFADAGL